MIHIAIRRAGASDASCLHRIRAEPSASRYQPLRTYSIERLRTMLGSRAADALDPAFDGKAQWVIDVDGRCAGWITIDVTSREHGVASVGYTVGEGWRGMARARRRHRRPPPGCRSRVRSGQTCFGALGSGYGSRECRVETGPGEGGIYGGRHRSRATRDRKIPSRSRSLRPAAPTRLTPRIRTLRPW